MNIWKPLTNTQYRTDKIEKLLIATSWGGSQEEPQRPPPKNREKAVPISELDHASQFYEFGNSSSEEEDLTFLSQKTSQMTLNTRFNKEMDIEISNQSLMSQSCRNNPEVTQSTNDTSHFSSYSGRTTQATSTYGLTQFSLTEPPTTMYYQNIPSQPQEATNEQRIVMPPREDFQLQPFPSPQRENLHYQMSNNFQGSCRALQSEMDSQYQDLSTQFSDNFHNQVIQPQIKMDSRPQNTQGQAKESFFSPKRFQTQANENGTQNVQTQVLLQKLHQNTKFDNLTTGKVKRVQIKKKSQNSGYIPQNDSSMDDDIDKVDSGSEKKSKFSKRSEEKPNIITAVIEVKFDLNAKPESIERRMASKISKKIKKFKTFSRTKQKQH